MHLWVSAIAAVLLLPCCAHQPLAKPPQQAMTDDYVVITPDVSVSRNAESAPERTAINDVHEAADEDVMSEILATPRGVARDSEAATYR